MTFNFRFANCSVTSAMKTFGLPVRAAAVALLLGLTLRPAHAQLADTVFAAGTVTQDPQLRHWAYLVLQPSDYDLLAQKKIAVYAKSGDAASTAPFVRKAVIQRQSDPLIIQALLQRGVNLGDDLAAVEDHVSRMFAAVVPHPNLTLAQKLSAVMLGIAARPESRADLIILGRTHPAVNLALGLGHAEQIAPGQTTFELREFDVAGNRDVSVLGRVTVTAGSPTVLPAPGRPVALPDTSAKGHLNARFRWASPDELSRLAILSHGFNLYRMTRAQAEASNFHVTPPTPALLRALAAQGTTTWLVNPLPALKSKDFTAANVSDFVADPKTMFVADDNNLVDESSVRFANGAEFYYFVTARDILGRDGLVSPGTLVMMCDRVPPYAPRNLQVDNFYTFVPGPNTNIHKLKVTWQQVTNVTDEAITGYYVYRWHHSTDVVKFGGNPLFNRISGFIPHVPGQRNNSFLDDGPGSPTMPQDASKTFWYTVVAVDNGACDGGNLSPHSAPVFGVLRDRTGPDAPTGGVDILCCDPMVATNGTSDLLLANFDTDLAFFDFVCERESRDLAWADFAFGNLSNKVARVFFPRHGDRAVFRLKLPRRDYSPTSQFNFFCQVGDFGGKTSTVAQLVVTGMPTDREVRRVQFRGLSRCGYVRLDDNARRGGCVSHNPHPGNGGLGGLGSNGIAGLKLSVDLTPTTREYKIYRRVDGGPLSLIKQGFANYTNTPQVELEDKDMPPSASTICYFAQLFDVHGNNSPMTPLGDCVDVSQPAPQPLLTGLAPYGNENNPQMLVKWFCPIEGIERFEVAIGVNIGSIPKTVSPLLSDLVDSGGGLHFKLAGEAENVDDPKPTIAYGVYQTPRPGPGFGTGAGFEVPVNITPGRKYTVQIVAIPVGGGTRGYSNVRTYSWSPEDPADATGPNVPWPQRPQPPIAEGFDPRLAPVCEFAQLGGVGIRIGSIDSSNLVSAIYNGQPFQAIRGYVDPNHFTYIDQLAEKGLGQHLIPAVTLYRYQVPSTKFPNVSGDLVQVTPFMDRIAHNKLLATVQGQPTEVTRLVDPFVKLLDLDTQTPEYELFLVDTQPVVRKAAYAYLAVRHNKLGEVLDVIPVGQVEVP